MTNKAYQRTSLCYLFLEHFSVPGPRFGIGGFLEAHVSSATVASVQRQMQLQPFDLLLSKHVGQILERIYNVNTTEVQDIATHAIPQLLQLPGAVRRLGDGFKKETESSIATLACFDPTAHLDHRRR